MKTIYTFDKLNFALGIIGMTGVWLTTHNWWAMFWAFIAALHIQFTVRD